MMIEEKGKMLLNVIYGLMKAKEPVLRGVGVGRAGCWEGQWAMGKKRGGLPWLLGRAVGKKRGS
jgi:hypothetical protein